MSIYDEATYVTGWVTVGVTGAGAVKGRKLPSQIESGVQARSLCNSQSKYSTKLGGAPPTRR